MMEPAIRFDSACFEINGNRLVGPLDLEVFPGETVVLLGESGSGKTTTLRLINRLVDATAGNVFVDGISVSHWEPIQLRRRIGYMIQEVGLLPHLSVTENIGLVPMLEGWPEPMRRERVETMLDLVGLSPPEFRDRFPHELSGGQRQRVGVARALAADPPTLLCDEAFGALDPLTRAELRREFRVLVHKFEKTVVFVTHDVREALVLADRIVLLDQGKAVFDGSADEFRSSQVALAKALMELE